MPKDYSFLSTFKWLIINLFTSPKNKNYLKNKIQELSKNTEIIISTFPFPKIISGIPTKIKTIMETSIATEKYL